METAKKFYSAIGLSRLIITLFLLFLFAMVVVLEIDLYMAISDCLSRIGRNGLFTLAMMISIVCGAGLNFGLPIGIVCGLVGGVISLEYNMQGFAGFFVAVLISVPLAVIAGTLYGNILNRVKGSEMMVGNYLAFSVVSLFCIVWIFFPVKNTKIMWPMLGYGVRTTVTLDDYYSKILDTFLAIKFDNGLVIPTGLFIFFILGCIGVCIFLKTKTGIMMACCGSNPEFARFIGINVNKMRILGIVISTILAAAGIVVYAQSFGFYQFYSAPLMMAFQAIASVLIGGATPRKAHISHVIIGTVLFQSILTIAMPVANKAVSAGSLSEIARVLVCNGIILYALTKINRGK